ncbi:Acg family FMN-binding oxidoreductase [Nocardia sp. CA-136227]|uniref:Acg family FMN-binding oxidoreductase n=1 Tax=Nocardia sp. CA-136227 TaxID=3239979 RepID=UPI003D99D112
MTTMNATPLVPDHRTLMSAMRLASRAPSVHNTQPWHWRFDGAHLHLHTDPDRALVTADPQGRQQVISCGAMLHHVRTAFGAHGWHTDTTRLPDPSDPGRLAEIGFRPWPDPPAGLVARARAIDHRRTDRLPLDPPEHWDDVARRLRMLVSPHYVDMEVLDESVRPRLAAVSEQAAALRRHDQMYQAEIGWWAGHSGFPEGVPTDALISDAERARVRVGRTFPSAPHSARRPDIEDRSRLVVLSTPADSASDWLATGEALSAILLECTVAGLATCALTHITELPTGRNILTGFLPRPGHPQLVVRIGAAPADEPEHPPTPRRPLADTLTIDRH